MRKKISNSISNFTGPPSYYILVFTFSLMIFLVETGEIFQKADACLTLPALSCLSRKDEYKEKEFKFKYPNSS